jgi:hypothetical protein
MMWNRTAVTAGAGVMLVVAVAVVAGDYPNAGQDRFDAEHRFRESYERRDLTSDQRFEQWITARVRGGGVGRPPHHGRDRPHSMLSGWRGEGMAATIRRTTRRAIRSAWNGSSRG